MGSGYSRSRPMSRRKYLPSKLMPLYDRIMLRKHSVIESLNDMLKNVARLSIPDTAVCITS